MTTFAMPMRFENGEPVMAEQGSADHLQARIAVTMRTSPGDRMSSPTFGTELPEFEPSDTDAVGVALAQVNQWVPEATADDIQATLEVLS